MDLVLNNLQRLICHKTKQTKPNGRGFLKPEFFTENTLKKFCSLLFENPKSVVEIKSPKLEFS